MSKMKRRLSEGVLLLMLFALAVPAYGAEDAGKQVARMNKKAMQDYDSLEFESARKTLIDAMAILRAAGTDETALGAKTYINLGIIYIAGFKDRNRGQQQFVSALKIVPDLKLDPAIATPELEEAFAAAQKIVKVKPAAPVEPPSESPKTEPSENPEPAEQGGEPKGLMHTPIDESRPGEEITMRALVGPGLNPKSILILYRLAGQDGFTITQMKHGDGSEWVGTIPPDEVHGKALQYYLDARDGRGKSIASSGSAVEPYIVRLEGAPLIAAGVAPVKETKPKRSYDRLFLFLMPGFGVGYAPASAHTEVAWQLGPQGLYRQLPVGKGGAVIAPFHLSLEVGWMFTKNFSLSALGRFQVATGANAETDSSFPASQRSTKAIGAAAGLLRARFRFLNGKFHPYVHIDIGGGEIRQMLDVSSAMDPKSPPLVDRYSGESLNLGNTMITPQRVCPASGNCIDSIAIGTFLIGGGAGLWWDVAKHFALIFDVNLLGAIGTGNDSSGMNVDIQLGVGTHFL